MSNRGINKAIIVGTLGRDPDVKHTAGGGCIVSVSVATNEAWKDRSTGEQQERTEWHRIVIFGKLAEIAAQYLKKGGQVYFEGRLQTRKWQGQDGQDRYTTEIVANEMQMLGSKPATGQPPADSQAAQQAASDYRAASGGSKQAAPPAGNDGFDDIPF